MSINWASPTRWNNILTLLNQKREIIDFEPIEHTFENYVKQSDINTLRNGTVEILPTYDYTLVTALHDAGYNYDTWKTWDKNWIAKRSLDEIEDILNLLVLVFVGVHCHNPEGKEINSIEGVSHQAVEIYDGEELIGYGAENEEEHNQPFYLSVGNHVIKAKFNGMTLEKNIMVESAEESQTIVFTFSRIEWNVTDWITSLNSVGSLIDDPRVMGGSALWLSAKDLFLYAKAREPDGYAEATVSVFTGSSFQAILTVIDSGNGSYGHVGVCSSGIMDGMSVTLPNKSPYTLWYCQCERSADYLPIYRKTVGWLPITNGITTFPSIERITFVGHLCYYWGQGTLTVNGTLQLKISSVPYDLKGTAV